MTDQAGSSFHHTALADPRVNGYALLASFFEIDNREVSQG